jgi:protein SCO1/2
MKRRDFLRTTGSFCAVASTGCVGILGDGAENVVLPPQEDQLGDSEDLAYPAYGQEFPEFTLPNPLTGETVESVDDDRVTVSTAIYATCPAECLVLGNQLAGVQSALNERGLTEEVRFVVVTFDPRRDTEKVLRDYADRMGINTETNWSFMRPKDPSEAEDVVTGKLGIGFQREGDTFIHPSYTFLVNPDGYVERAYRGERPEVERVSEDVETVAKEFA